MNYELKNIEELIPNIRNPRKHPDEQISLIAGSIQEFGFLMPILIDERNTIIAGEGRWLAGKKLKLAQVPVVRCDSLTDIQKKAYLIADNRLAEKSEWDFEMLSLNMQELKGFDFKTDLTGFSDKEFSKLFRKAYHSEGLTDENDTPTPHKNPVTKPGTIWQLGKHRLMCGDSTDAAAVASLMDGRKAALMVTDPPYGVNYDASWRKKTKEGNAEYSEGKVLNDHRADWMAAYELFEGSVAYIWHASINANVVAANLEALGFELRGQIIWAKQHFVLSRGHYHPQHEPCWYAVKRGGQANWHGDRKQSTLWEIANASATSKNKDDGKTAHSTQKPVECMRRPILNNSAPGEIIYDPFLGSGTTLIAAQTENRICFGMELKPAYCDIIVNRWQNFTGQKAEKIQ